MRDVGVTGDFGIEVHEIGQGKALISFWGILQQEFYILQT